MTLTGPKEVRALVRNFLLLKYQQLTAFKIIKERVPFMNKVEFSDVANHCIFFGPIDSVSLALVMCRIKV